MLCVDDLLFRRKGRVEMITESSLSVPFGIHHYLDLLDEGKCGDLRHMLRTREPLDLLQIPRRFPESTRTQPPKADAVPHPNREQKTVLREFPLVEADSSAELWSCSSWATEGETAQCGSRDGSGGDVSAVQSVGVHVGVG